MTQTTLPSKYTVNPKKLDKYLPRLLNGEAHKLEAWLPNLFSTGGILEREAYDYRTTQFKRRDPNQYNTKITILIKKLDEMNHEKTQLLLEIAAFKAAVDFAYEKSKKHL